MRGEQIFSLKQFYFERVDGRGVTLLAEISNSEIALTERSLEFYIQEGTYNFC